MKYTVTADFIGYGQRKTVLDYLKKELMLSSGMITRLKRLEDGILLNGTHVTVRAQLSEGDVIALKLEDIPGEENENIPPVEMPLDIIYEDDDIIVPNKPYNMPTHPSHKHPDDTLANGLAYYFKSKNIPFVFRAVNRLDRDTSGIVIVAKNRAAAWQLSRQMQEKSIQKTYIALVHGKTEPEGEVCANIKRSLPSIIERQVCPENEGETAHTVYRRLAANDSFSLIEVHPITGRTHQIRVHMAHIGHPIVGDTLYGSFDDTALISRQALHCSSISFDRADGRRLELTAELAPDIRAAADKVLK